MSTVIGVASIKIRPDTDGFTRAIKDQIASSGQDPVVKVIADTEDFGENVQKAAGRIEDNLADMNIGKNLSNTFDENIKKIEKKAKALSQSKDLVLRPRNTELDLQDVVIGEIWEEPQKQFDTFADYMRRWVRNYNRTIEGVERLEIEAPGRFIGDQDGDVRDLNKTTDLVMRLDDRYKQVVKTADQASKAVVKWQKKTQDLVKYDADNIGNNARIFDNRSLDDIRRRAEGIGKEIELWVDPIAKARQETLELKRLADSMRGPIVAGPAPGLDNERVSLLERSWAKARRSLSEYQKQRRQSESYQKRIAAREAAQLKRVQRRAEGFKELKQSMRSATRAIGKGGVAFDRKLGRPLGKIRQEFQFIGRATSSLGRVLSTGVSSSLRSVLSLSGKFTGGLSKLGSVAGGTFTKIIGKSKLLSKGIGKAAGMLNTLGTAFKRSIIGIGVVAFTKAVQFVSYLQDGLMESLGNLSGLTMFKNMIKDVLTLTRNTGRLPDVFGPVITIAGMMGNSIMALSANILSLGYDVAKAVPIIGLLPGVLATFGPGALIVKRAMQDAGKEIEETTAKFKKLGESVSKRFWQEAGEPLRRLADSTMPSIQQGSEMAARSLGNLAEALIDSTREASSGKIEGFFTNLSNSATVLSGHTDEIVKGFFDMAEVGSNMLPKLTSRFGNLLDRFGKWTQKISGDGSLERWINDSIDALSDMASVVKSTISILGSFAKAAAASGAMRLDGLAKSLVGIRETVASDEFQYGLTRAFDAANQSMKRFATEAGPGVVQLFQKLPGLMQRTSPLIGEAAGKLVGYVADLISSEPVLRGYENIVRGINKAVEAMKPAFESTKRPLGDFLYLIGDLTENRGKMFSNYLEGLNGFATALQPVFGAFSLKVSEMGVAFSEVVKEAGAFYALKFGPKVRDDHTEVGTLADKMQRLDEEQVAATNSGKNWLTEVIDGGLDKVQEWYEYIKGIDWTGMAAKIDSWLSPENLTTLKDMAKGASDLALALTSLSGSVGKVDEDTSLLNLSLRLGAHALKNFFLGKSSFDTTATTEAEGAASLKRGIEALGNQTNQTSAVYADGIGLMVGKSAELEESVRTSYQSATASAYDGEIALGQSTSGIQASFASLNTSVDTNLGSAGATIGDWSSSSKSDLDSTADTASLSSKRGFNELKSNVATTMKLVRVALQVSVRAMNQQMTEMARQATNKSRESERAFNGLKSRSPGLLRTAGQAIMRGFIGGISSMISSLKAKLRYITGLVPANKGPLNKDRKLLVPAGQAIMGGFIKALESRIPHLVRVLGRITQVSRDAFGLIPTEYGTVRTGFQYRLQKSGGRGIFDPVASPTQRHLVINYNQYSDRQAPIRTLHRDVREMLDDEKIWRGANA